MKHYFIVFTLLFLSCSSNGPEQIVLNKDACHFCKMAISDGRFGAEVITEKGRVYKFDDFSCMMGFADASSEIGIKHYYVGDYSKENELIDAGSAFFVESEELRSPMNGNVAAFSSKEAADASARKLQANTITWKDLENHSDGHSH